MRSNPRLRDRLARKLIFTAQKLAGPHKQQIISLSGRPLPACWARNNDYGRPFAVKTARWAYLSHDAKIAYVHNTKCASTALKYFLFELTRGYPYAINTEFPEQNIHFSPRAFARAERLNHPQHHLNTKAGAIKSYHINSITKACTDKNAFVFSFVRHPYQRALSAYYSKIINDSHHAYFQVRDKLVCHYGLDLTRPDLPKNFSLFVQYLLDEKNNNSLFDVHFLPQTETIDFENTHFDFIGKIENFTSDLEKVVSGIKAKSTIILHPCLMNKKDANRSARNKGDAQVFFNNKNKIMLQSLYQQDFDLLGYDL